MEQNVFLLFILKLWVAHLLTRVVVEFLAVRPKKRSSSLPFPSSPLSSKEGVDCLGF